MSGHPWSSSPAAQAAVRRAEGDPGPTLQHRDLPEVVEHLVERVRALEAAHNGLVEVAKIDARWMRCAAPEKCETERLTDEQPAAAAVTNPMPEATTGSGYGTGLRTERVTLEVRLHTLCSVETWAWHHALMMAYPMAGVESVRVVPTPGPGLTKEEREALEWFCNVSSPLHKPARDVIADLRALLARDAAARESGSSGSELGSK